MRGGRARGTLPLRAMLYGELVDTAVVLFRERALPLLLLALPLQALEQIAVWYAGAPFLDEYANFTVWWQVIATVLAGDAVIVLLLGAYAGAAAVPALLGDRVSHRALFKRMRPLPLLATAILPALAAWPAAYFGLAGLIAVFGLLGLAGAALAIDRARWPFGALGRSAMLVTRSGSRGVRIRIVSVVIWLGIRLALAIGPILFLWQFGLVADGYLGDWPVLLMWGLAGTVSCAALACLDAVVLIDTRIRIEGLDIAVRRALMNGTDPAAVLVHTRPADTVPMQVSAHPGLPPWPQALVRPSVPAGLSRQAQLQWMQAQAQAQYQTRRPDEERES
jgi:MFS family permease